MHNPKAGRGKHDKNELLAALARAGHHATYQSTKKNDYKKALKKSADLVLAAGGDGTIGKVGRELIDSDIPLSVLPLGTANNLAQSWFHRAGRTTHYPARRRKKASV
jgi:diacylglycerol kinase (ATP)